MTYSLFRGRHILGVFIIGINVCAQALSITNGPFLIQTNSAPLACKIQLSTETDSRVSVQVSTGTNTWSKGFFNYTNNHSVILAGFTPDTTNVITVSVKDRAGNSVTAPAPLTFQTSPLPATFPRITLRTNQPSRMEPGYTLFRAANVGSQAFLVIVNNQGEVVWYSNTTTLLDVRQRPNGNIFAYTASTFFEINLFAEVVASWPMAPGYPIDSHDGVPTDHGTILYLSGATQSVTNFPGSSTDSNALPHTVTITHQPVVEISMTNPAAFQVWRTIDMIDPLHVTYFYLGGINNVDFEHSNAVSEDLRDDSLMVSMRHQNAVIKFARTNGQLKWILGPHENYAPAYQPYLLTPVGEPFAWNYAQHAPKVTPQGTLLIFDNGNFRASPFAVSVANSNNYSRAVEYSINENTMEVSQLWTFGSNVVERLFSPTVGDVDQLPKSGNMLVTFGNVRFINGATTSSNNAIASMIRIQEVTHTEPAEIIFDLEVFNRTNTSPAYNGCSGYRSDRIPSLYSSIPMAVQDLRAGLTNGLTCLAFSADPVMNHRIQVSTNFVSWTDLGSPTNSSGLGDFLFADQDSTQSGARFYRVVSSTP
ncbi:MAG: aryl-sulfate sulfotransferase [Verrucomicrobiota bacterium]